MAFLGGKWRGRENEEGRDEEDGFERIAVSHQHSQQERP